MDNRALAGYEQISTYPAYIGSPPSHHPYDNNAHNANAYAHILRHGDRRNNRLDTRNNPVSGRYYVGMVRKQMNYPNAANAPRSRVSQWFSSAGTGMKKFRGFSIPPRIQIRYTYVIVFYKIKCITFETTGVIALYRKIKVPQDAVLGTSHFLFINDTREIFALFL